MPLGAWTPIPPKTYTWDTTHTVYNGVPVVYSTTNDQVTLPAGTAADRLAGVSIEDAGPNAANQAATQAQVNVQKYGTAKMYGKGGITAGQAVKVNSASITVTIPGYSTVQTVWPVTTATQTSAGSQPFPIVGVALNSTTSDGDIVYVDLDIGATY